jgi:hypothetical protein
MPRKSGGVEIGVRVGLLASVTDAAGCVSAGGLPAADIPPVPAGIGEARAIQCAGLARAIDSILPRIQPLNFGIAYAAWAYSLTGEHDRSAVNRNIETSRQTFTRQAGEGESWDRHQRLLGTYEATRSKCGASSGPDDFVVAYRR